MELIDKCSLGGQDSDGSVGECPNIKFMLYLIPQNIFNNLE